MIKRTGTVDESCIEFKEQMTRKYGLEDYPRMIHNSIPFHLKHCCDFMKLAHNLVDKPKKFVRIRPELKQMPNYAALSNRRELK